MDKKIKRVSFAKDFITANYIVPAGTVLEYYPERLYCYYHSIIENREVKFAASFTENEIRNSKTGLFKIEYDTEVNLIN